MDTKMPALFSSPLIGLLVLLLAWPCPAAPAPVPTDSGERELPVFTHTGADWKPVGGSAPPEAASEETPDGGASTKFLCEMQQVDERANWDRDVKLDLAGCGGVSLWAKATGDAAAIAHATLYFKSGAGWYAASLEAGFGGWKRVVLHRESFRSEGTPTGWGAIGGARVSFWKGEDRRASVLLGGMRAIKADVIVVRNTRGGREAGIFAGRMAEALKRAGIDSCILDDTDVEQGALAGKKISVYPHNPRPSERELEAVETFTEEGGRLLVCYSLPGRLAKLLGIESLGHLRQSHDGQFARMRFLPERPTGLPEEVKQASWNITRVRPGSEETRVIAVWHDRDDKSTGYPAVVLGSKGAYISHVLLDDDAESKTRLLRALLGHLRPDLWESIARDALKRTGTLSTWESFDDSVSGTRRTAASAGRSGPVEERLEQATRAFKEARGLLAGKHYQDALEALNHTRVLLLEAFTRAQPARKDEFRGVWCHSAYGPRGLGWNVAIRRLSESGFNAVVPNMLWAGVADYKSSVLPVRSRVKEEGDQISLCLAACKKHGVEIHVWKVNWNLSGAPRVFVDKLRSDGRLQKARDGSEAPWLCPSHPDNFELERDSLLEVAREYEVDGIHFDYIRYPDGSKCYCDGCRARFEKTTGKKVATWPQDVSPKGSRHAAYQDFRRSCITRLVQTVSEEARRARPGILISAAVFSNWPRCREDVAQDWVHWIKEGYLDFVCPMNYSASNGGFRDRVRVQLEAVNGRIPLYSGVGASAPGLPLDQVIDQVQIARTAGADGFIIFNYDGPVATDYIPALGLGTTAGRTLPPHRTRDARGRPDKKKNKR